MKNKIIMLLSAALVLTSISAFAQNFQEKFSKRVDQINGFTQEQISQITDGKVLSLQQKQALEEEKQLREALTKQDALKKHIEELEAKQELYKACESDDKENTAVLKYNATIIQQAKKTYENNTKAIQAKKYYLVTNPKYLLKRTLCVLHASDIHFNINDFYIAEDKANYKKHGEMMEVNPWEKIMEDIFLLKKATTITAGKQIKLLDIFCPEDFEKIFPKSFKISLAGNVKQYALLEPGTDEISKNKNVSWLWNDFKGKYKYQFDFRIINLEDYNKFYKPATVNTKFKDEDLQNAYLLINITPIENAGTESLPDNDISLGFYEDGNIYLKLYVNAEDKKYTKTINIAKKMK